MKMIGFIRFEGRDHMVLKGDSALLNNRKPFFMPEGTEKVSACPCCILRVSRLGKHIEPRYASRYYDAVAYGMDFRLEGWMRQGNWVRGCSFDYSLAVGTFVEGQNLPPMEYLQTADEAIAAISKMMTIRQGDYIFIDTTDEPRELNKEEILTYKHNGQELFYCKIK